MDRKKIAILLAALLGVTAIGALVFCLWPVSYGDGVALSKENFPDRKLRNYISENYDKDGSRSLSEDEIREATHIVLIEEGVSDLKGIEFLTELEVVSCDKNQLKSVDVSKNLKLKVLEIRGNKLTSLDVSKNSELQQLKCGFNDLKSLDVSQNPELWDLVCTDCDLTSLDVSRNTKLENLYCGQNRLTSLDLSNNTELKYLACPDNQITELNVSGCRKLKKLDCTKNPLQELDTGTNWEVDITIDEDKLPMKSSK